MILSGELRMGILYLFQAPAGPIGMGLCLVALLSSSPASTRGVSADTAAHKGISPGNGGTQ